MMRKRTKLNFGLSRTMLNPAMEAAMTTTTAPPASGVDQGVEEVGVQLVLGRSPLRRFCKEVNCGRGAGKTSATRNPWGLLKETRIVLSTGRSHSGAEDDEYDVQGNDPQ